MRLIVAWLGCCLVSGLMAAATPPDLTDSFHIQHYYLHLDISHVESEAISGFCKIESQSKVAGLRTVSLDLLQLSVDSIKVGNMGIGFTYNDTLLTVRLPGTGLDSGINTSFTIYYHGKPQHDATWGGFYFTDGLAYNMGVGFSANPHSFGRCWFPCVDNFKDKALFDFYITTSGTNRALCNGLLADSTTNPSNGNITWHWHSQHPIAAYMASVAVGPYAIVQSKYAGIKDTFPVILAAPASDTLNMVRSFRNLAWAIACFEKAYGPQPFEKVGFTSVPFMEGAMEHPGNIAYPSNTIDGTNKNEDLFAHELSHHWWGDWVTCETEQDMWLNEGWASFSVFLYHEYLYNHNDYIRQVSHNHLAVLQSAATQDRGYLAISGSDISHGNTYGAHVYKKAADVIYNLRTYLGDSLFFKGIKAHLQLQAFGNSNTQQFKDDLMASTGVDLTAFFDNWVLHAGYPHFAITKKSYQVSPIDGSCKAKLSIDQRLYHAPQYFSQVPLEIVFFDKHFKSVTRRIVMSGQTLDFLLDLPFLPAYVGLNFNNTLSDASTSDYRLITPSKGSHSLGFSDQDLYLSYKDVNDTVLLRVVHHYVAPDSSKLYYLAAHYWTLEGMAAKGLSPNGKLYFNAMLHGLDHDLLRSHKGKLMLLYRKQPMDEWQVLKTLGDTKDFVQQADEIELPNMLLGEYTFGVKRN